MRFPARRRVEPARARPPHRIRTRLLRLTRHNVTLVHCYRIASLFRDLPSLAEPMTELPPATRVRRASMRLGVLISALVFFLFGGTVLLDQWLDGQVGTGFMLGTALMIAGLCIGLFAIIVALGSAISMAFRGDPSP